MDGFAYNQSVELSATDQTVYQQDVVIHRTAGIPYEELVGGLYVLHFYVGDKCKADYGDVRFTDASGIALAYYLWPDYDNSSARFCVRLEGATSAGQMQVWYGNSAAATTSDGDATYLLCDDFHDLSKWTILPGNGAISASNDTMVCSYTGSQINDWWSSNRHQKVAVITPPSAPFEVEVQMSVADNPAFFAGIAAYQDDIHAYMVGRAHYASYWNNYHVAKLGQDNIATYLSSTVPAKLKIRNNGGTYSFHIDIGSGWIQIGSSYSDLAFNKIGLFGKEFGSTNLTVVFSQFRVRAYSATQPRALSFSEEQVVGGSKASTGVAFGSANMMVI